MAKKLGKDPFVLLLSWAVQRGTAVLAKSVNPAHIEANFQGNAEAKSFRQGNSILYPSELIITCVHAVDFIIPDAEFEAPSKLDRHHRYNYPPMGGVDVFGEQGQNEVERRAEETAAKHRKQ